ncbi:MAG: FtsW/RodA/SpoVE family cell cycle protein [Bacilli bacterium]|jgi:cell division protein FtsW|nr:FtsW/RodA/SpoVE family cell cycle protein [Bacilli bacterium]
MAKKKYLLDPIIYYSVILLTIFGFIMVVSAHAIVYVNYGAFKFFFEIFKIFVFIIVGFLLMNFISKRLNDRWLYKYLNIFYLIVAIMMLATLFFPEVNGAKAWINLYFITIQPVEFVKIAMIIYLSTYFGNVANSNKKISQMLMPPVLVFIGVFLFVFIFQNDLGSALIIAMITLCIFFATPIKKLNKIKFLIFFILVIGIVLFYLNGHAISQWIYSLPEGARFKNQLLRIAVLFDPFKQVYTSGYQLSNSLAALSESFFGKGLGNSTIKFIVPEPYNDAILSVIGEETGIFGILFIFIIYFILVFQLLNYASRKNVSIKDSLILVGIASFIMAQFFVNVGGMVGVIPMTGVTLLFISSGGSSIISAFILIGFAQLIIKKYIR